MFVTSEAAQRESALVESAARAGVETRLVSERVLGALRDTVTPQGLVAVVATPRVDLADACAVPPQLVVVLDRVADPGNAGTVIRTADAAGASAVIVSRGSVDVWSGKCVRSSAGGVFHLPIATGASSEAAIVAAKAAGCAVLATAADGSIGLDDLIDSGSLTGPTAWVFGNEAHGLPAAVCDLADRVVRVPIYGRAESLNLAATAAICLYASARASRRRLP